MIKKDRIEALETVLDRDVIVESQWWDWVTPVRWRVTDSKYSLSEEQYSYLTRNRYLEVKDEPVFKEKVILRISEAGKQRLHKFKSES